MALRPGGGDDRGLRFPTIPGVAEPLPEGEEKVRTVRAMFDRIAPRYDLVNRVMTFGLDVGWRRRAVRSLRLASGSLVFDVGCGTGDLCRELAEQGLRPVGFDLSLGMLAAARTSAPLVQADGLRLPVPDRSADGVTCGFTLRNLVDLDRFLAELGRIVRPGGRVALLEVGQPTNPLLRTGHEVYFGRIVPRIGALLSDGAAYRYLPRSVAYLPPPTELVARFAAAGFADAARMAITGGIAQLLVGTRDGR